MPADLMMSDASLMNRKYNCEGYKELRAELSRRGIDDYGLIRAMGYLDHFYIKVSPSKNNGYTEWTVSQTDYFKMVDLILLLSAGRLLGDITVTSTDLAPFRKVVAATVASCSEILVYQLLYGINDENTYIDNRNNTMCYTTKSFQRMLRMVDDNLGAG